MTDAEIRLALLKRYGDEHNYETLEKFFKYVKKGTIPTVVKPEAPKVLDDDE